jgi:hypothetical protein
MIFYEPEMLGYLGMIPLTNHDSSYLLPTIYLVGGILTPLKNISQLG